jgi:hypothetical protein
MLRITTDHGHKRETEDDSNEQYFSRSEPSLIVSFVIDGMVLKLTRTPLLRSI